MVNKINKSRIYPLFAIAALIFVQMLFLPTLSNAVSIVIKPGKLDHLVLQIPGKPVAGEIVTLSVKAYDRHNNLITNYAETGKDIQVSVSGAARATPSLLKASSFTSGSATFNIQDIKAEKIVLSLTDVSIKAQLYKKEITIYPGDLDHFSLKAPKSAIAGERFKVRVTAKDKFDNIVVDIKMRKALKVQSVGSTQIEDIAFPDFTKGVSTISAVAKKTGSTAVEVMDMNTSIRGRSLDMAIVPTDLDHFDVTAPAEAEAGTPFKATVIAYDRFDNLIVGYGTSGKGVQIRTSGSGPLSPSYVSPLEFKGGSATVALLYTKAETMALSVKEKEGNQGGKSSDVTVGPAPAEFLKISSPEEATADEGFRVKITVYDRFNNQVKDYSRTGKEVFLRASGTGRLSPKVVAAKEFINGVAAVDISYDKAESISISASLSPAKEALPRKEEKKAPPAVKRPEAREKAQEKVVRKVVPREVIKEQRIFGITDIKLVEAGPRALLIVEIPGLSKALQYETKLETLGGKDVIRLRLKPAEKEIYKEVTFTSNIIGDITVNDDPQQRTVDIVIELLSKKVQYSVKNSENLVIIDILRLGLPN